MVAGVLEGSVQVGGSGGRLFVYSGNGKPLGRWYVAESSSIGKRAQIVVRRRERRVNSGSDGGQHG